MRKITFQSIGDVKGSQVWRNRETGVEIIKGKNFREIGLYYICVPTQGEDARLVVGTATKLTEARMKAHRSADSVREKIAEAFVEASAVNENMSPTVENAPATEIPTRVLEDATAVVDIKPEVIVPGLIGDDVSPTRVQVAQPKMGQDMSPLPVTGRYRVTFARIGRHRVVPDLEVKVSAAEVWNTVDEIARAVRRYARNYLATRFGYEVDVDMTYGRVLIDGGRFGEGKMVLIRESE